MGKVIAFLIVFGIVSRLVSWLFALLDKALRLLSIIPFLKTINRLTGAALGLFLGGLILSLLIYFGSRYPWSQPWLTATLKTSEVAPWLLRLNDLVIPLLPKVLQQLKSII